MAKKNKGMSPKNPEAWKRAGGMVVKDFKDLGKALKKNYKYGKSGAKYASKSVKNLFK